MSRPLFHALFRQRADERRGREGEVGRGRERGPEGGRGRGGEGRGGGEKEGREREREREYYEHITSGMRFTASVRMYLGLIQCIGCGCAHEKVLLLIVVLYCLWSQYTAHSTVHVCLCCALSSSTPYGRGAERKTAWLSLRSHPVRS